ncbi:MAG: flagellar basal body rod protein FlgC [Rickettsiaceae bacterium]
MMFSTNIRMVYAQNYLKQASQIARHGIQFQEQRMKIATENIANENSTATSPNQDPYQRKVIFAQNKYDKRAKTNVISTKKITNAKQIDRFIYKYDPYHPAANQQGYVKYPNINSAIEVMDINEAKTSIETNLSAMKISTDMMTKTIELISR